MIGAIAKSPLVSNLKISFLKLNLFFDNIVLLLVDI